MFYKELIQIDKAPEKGFVLAYTRQNIIFEEYSEKVYVAKLLENKDILEIHLFDANKEYRAISSTGNRKFGKNQQSEVAIEHIADFTSEHNEDYEIYKDNILLDKTDEKFKVDQDSITVINKILFDSNGMANIADYRLVIE